MAHDAIPAAVPWKVGDKTWMARLLPPVALQEIQNLLKASTPDPRLEAKKLVEGMPPELARHVWDEQMARAEPWPPTLGSEAGKAVLCSRDGMTTVIYHALRKSHGGFTREQAAALAEDVDFGEYAELLKIAFPHDEPNADERPTAAPAANGTPTPERPESPSGPLTSIPATNSA